MKQVKFAIATVGFAPVVAIAMPAVAHAAPTTARQPGTKVARTKYVVPHVVRNGCTGSVPFTIPRKDNVTGHGWYANNFPDSTCIGTEVVSLDFHAGSPNNPYCKSASAKLESSLHGTAYGPRTNLICGTNGQTKHTSFGWHVSISRDAFESVYACARSTNEATWTCKGV